MKKYSAYLFDIDGTLLDTTELIYQCFRYTCGKFGGMTLAKDEVVGNIGLTLRDQMEKYFGTLTDQRYRELADAHMEHQISIYKDYLGVFRGVHDTLRWLSTHGVPLAAVTSRRRQSLDLYLNEMDILSFFDSLVTPESTDHHKPHPEPALKAAEELGCQPENALFVGDSRFDIECGAAAGMDTALVGWSDNDSSSFSVVPTMLIREMKDLISYAQPFSET